MIKNDCLKCVDCRKVKDKATDFYFYSGYYRTRCKACTIKSNSLYKKRTLGRSLNLDIKENRKDYNREYYKKNKEKFAEYRAQFLAKHPEYYKEYFRKRKER